MFYARNINHDEGATTLSIMGQTAILSMLYWVSHFYSCTECFVTRLDITILILMGPKITQHDAMLSVAFFCWVTASDEHTSLLCCSIHYTCKRFNGAGPGDQNRQLIFPISSIGFPWKMSTFTLKSRLLWCGTRRRATWWQPY
jgi:hypothetical protein